MNGKLGDTGLGQFKLGDAELEATPSGGELIMAGGRRTDVDRRREEDEAIAFVLSQV